MAAGIAMLMVPDGSVPSAPAPLKLPISTGEAKLPVASESCAVKLFPALNVPVAVNAMVPLAPVVQSIEKGPPVMAPAVMVLGVPHGVMDCPAFSVPGEAALGPDQVNADPVFPDPVN